MYVKKTFDTMSTTQRWFSCWLWMSLMMSLASPESESWLWITSLLYPPDVKLDSVGFWGLCSVLILLCWEGAEQRFAV